jgi:hypothetical protein
VSASARRIGVSITHYRDMKAYLTRDGENSPLLFRQTTNRDKQWQFSQEVQVAAKLLDDRLNYGRHAPVRRFSLNTAVRYLDAKYTSAGKDWGRPRSCRSRRPVNS